MPQPQHPAAGILFVLFLIWMLFPDGDGQTQSPVQSDLAAERLSQYDDALGVLDTTSWGDFAPSGPDAAPRFLNLTGFRDADGFAWEDLGRFRERGLQLSRYAVPPVAGRQLWDVAQGAAVWANASGTLRGDWVRRPGSVARRFDSYNLSRSVPSMEWVGDDVEWARNMTGAAGRMTLRLEGNKTVTTYGQGEAGDGPLSGGVIRNVKGTVTIEDTMGSGFNWEMRLWGVHWPRQGVVVMATTSEKFEGIFGLPHLTPGLDFFRSSQMLLRQTLGGVVAKKRANANADQNMPWNSDIDNPLYTATPSPHCEFVMYAQVHPPLRQAPGRGDEPDAVEDVIRAIEAELQNPEGAPIRSVPQLKMSAVIYSPDCAFFLETRGPPEFPPAKAPGEADHLVGMKTEVHTHQVKMWMLVYALVVLAQVRLLKNQMKESFTPSTMGRISFWTISDMAMVDGMTFAAAATWVSSAAATFLPTLALMFASFLSMTIGGSFLAKIHEVQLPEGRHRDAGPPAPPRRPTPGRLTFGRMTPAPMSPATLTPGPPAPAPLTPISPLTSAPLPPAPLTPISPLTPAPLPPVSPRAPSFASRSPTASRSNSQPVIVPSDQDVDADIAANAAAGASALPRPFASASSNPAAANPSSSSSSPPPRQSPTFQAMVGRYILFSLCISFLAISSSTWYPRARSVFLNLCTFAYLSLWIPQIHRNTVRNCRRALCWQFVVGQSLLRLLPVAYFWVKEDNFLYARTDRLAFVLLCAWVWLQILVLAAQDVVGPRFGVPPAWTPDAWDYHPVLREDTVEAGGLPIGLLAAADDDDDDAASGPATPVSPASRRPSRRASHASAADEKKRGNVRAIDCAICRELLEVPVLTARDDEAGVASVFARRLYMVTPCRHIFHTTCLEGWMRFRLQCPICREELPPI